MATEVLMPKLGLTMTEGTVVNWLKNEGDTVEKGEELVEILTEKITNVAEAPASGILKKILVGPGETAKVSEPIGIIAAPGEEIEAPAAPAERAVPAAETATQAAEPAKRIKASPAAKKLAEEHGIALADIEGTGPGGRITREDVLKAVESKEAKPEPAAPVTEAAKTEGKRVPLAGMRKVIAQRMAESARTAPHVTVDMEVDMSQATAFRKSLNAVATESIGGKVSFTDIIVKVVARALEDFPVINASLQEEEIVYHGEINVGVAVALEDGLIVPVIKNTNKLGIGAISQLVKELAEKARSGKLTPDEYKGGTFTVTNLGMFGVDSFTPIINPPESAILGVNRIQKKPVVVNDEIVIRPMMTLSLSFDHRLIDGSVAAQFLQRVKALLENPDLLLL
ncbi:MAG TPA: 2-oxo acid dehydrogenase subunit E2 [Firmicutes bacterium]|nr:2-oxo acid dehydrogenase subunit E2 [Bacillota bacterium]